MLKSGIQWENISDAQFKRETMAGLSELGAICILAKQTPGHLGRDDGLCKQVGGGTTETFSHVVIGTVDNFLGSDLF